MESDPYAARAVLKEIEDGGVKMGKNSFQFPIFNSSSKEDAAFYAWLRTQVEYKCFAPQLSDSLVRFATEYYGTPRRRNHHAAMAWYTLGCVCAGQENDLEAIDAYLKALTLFPDTTGRYYSLAEQNLGILYLHRQMLDDALQTFRACSRRMQAAGKGKDLAYIDYYIALTHLYNKEYDEARQGFVATLACDSASHFLQGESLLHLAKISLYEADDYPVALDYINCHIAFTDARFLGVDYSMKGEVYYAMLQYDSAYSYYRRSLAYDNEVHTLCSNYKGLAELASLTGQTDSIAAYVSRYTLLLDSISELRRTEEIATLRNNHTLELQRRQMSYRQQWTWAMSAFIFLLVLLLALLWFVQRDRQRKSDYIALVDELRKSHLAKYETLQDTLENCCALFRRTTAYEIMTGTVDQSELDRKAPNLIAHDISTCFSTFRKAVKDEAPRVNEKEFMFIVCQYMGFDIRTISLFLTSAYSTLTSMKSRLRKKMPAELYSLLLTEPASPVTPS